ncbi:hypothetical protein [Endothiovibrio diazotrophicus]
MKLRIVRALPLALLLVSPVLRAEPLAEWLAATAGGKFEPAGPAELKAVREEFERLFRGEAEAGPWEILGFRLTRIGPFWALSEIDKRGRGAYLVRADGGDGVALQAPHRFADPGSGEIALKLMAEGRLAAAAWNSVARQGERQRAVEQDLARAAASHHTAFARAFARVHAEGRVVQLHRFAADRPTTEAGRGSAMVVGDGGLHPGARLLATAGCLRETLGEGVRHYPFQVRELGGSDNAVGMRLREAGFDGFLHLMLGEDMTARLRERAPERAALLGCLEGGA